ncbi:GlcG/HbpS family heme-binding protein [Thalassotalea agariperforans]
MKITKTLDHLDAKVAITAIEAELIKRKLDAAIAVADSSGEPLALLRVGNAALPTINIVMNKAWSAARDKKPTKEIGNEVKDKQNSFDIAYYGDQRFVGWGGGLPVFNDNQVVGAVAVSGLPEAIDMELAQIGLCAIEAQLN